MRKSKEAVPPAPSKQPPKLIKHSNSTTIPNNQTANAAYNPYQGYPNANYAAPNFQGYGGSNNMSSGWNAGSNWGGGSAGGAANTGHNMLWTV